MTGRAWSDLSWFLGDALSRQTASPGLLDVLARRLPARPATPPANSCRQQVGPLIGELVRAAREAGEVAP